MAVIRPAITWVGVLIKKSACSYFDIFLNIQRKKKNNFDNQDKCTWHGVVSVAAIFPLREKGEKKQPSWFDAKEKKL